MLLKREAYNRIVDESVEKEKRVEELEKEVLQLVLQLDEIDTTRQELESLIGEAQKIKKEAHLKFTKVEQPSDGQQFAYLDSLSNVLKNKHFQWFVYEIREMIISQIAGNMQVKGARFFMANTEEVSGGIKAIDYLVQQLEEKRGQYNSVIEAENAKK